MARPTTNLQINGALKQTLTLELVVGAPPTADGSFLSLVARGQVLSRW